MGVLIKVDWALWGVLVITPIARGELTDWPELLVESGALGTPSSDVW